MDEVNKSRDLKSRDLGVTYVLDLLNLKKEDN